MDRKRLGKQRIEALQIAEILLGVSTSKGWVNHPVVKMWKGYESFLVHMYIPSIFQEWKTRGYKNTKCELKYRNLFLLASTVIITPHWLTYDFIERHRSNLVRKNPEYYSNLFPEVSDSLPYLWPIN